MRMYVPGRARRQALLLTGLALLCVSLPRQSLSAAKSDAKDRPPIPDIAAPTPVNSGPGVVVCDPVCDARDRSLGDFGAGCGRWLFLVAGSQPEFGKTPLWWSLNRVRQELGRPNLQLSAQDGARLARRLGATHFVAGTLGGGPRLTLTYRLY